MSNAPSDQSKVRIRLTPEQVSQIKATTGHDAEAIELTIQELEQRIVPTIFTSPSLVPPSEMLAANSNETVLVA